LVGWQSVGVPKPRSALNRIVTTRRSPLAIVTGASRGLGRLITRELAGAAVDVLMIGRDGQALQETAREAERSGPATIHACQCDIGDPTAIETILGAAERLGGADILINNAATQGPIGNAWEVNEDDFAGTIRTNLLIPIALVRAVLPGMLARGAGWIVNISGGGATGPRPMFSAYATAKCGLVRFGETLAAEVGGRGIRVNSVAPGAFASSMTHAVMASGAAAGKSETDGAARLLAGNDNTNAVKAAELVAYLVAGEGREITGKLISAVWDPWRELHRRWDEIRNTDIYTLRRIVPSDRQLDWG
jgi:NAD(P)-dependent dehydrogenase (short-subunit alcohol dehydrogenase family)